MEKPRTIDFLIGELTLNLGDLSCIIGGHVVIERDNRVYIESRINLPRKLLAYLFIVAVCWKYSGPIQQKKSDAMVTVRQRCVLHTRGHISADQKSKCLSTGKLLFH
ncbi:hypothetical protein SDC9_119947 [bioreactor metagenome]|uniref:Uncharacterized protein n=1 Tax=bioreactor metagenome TaxID=1076179 RepID=A0A645C7J3_9ZZZZ